jgi:hypothetical protein
MERFPTIFILLAILAAAAAADDNDKPELLIGDLLDSVANDVHGETSGGYVFGVKNTNACPIGSAPIDSAASCQAAAQAKSLRWKSSGSYASSPKGCFVYSWFTGYTRVHHVYFNEHSSGSADSRGAPLCKKAATPTPTEPTATRNAEDTVLGLVNTKVCPAGSERISSAADCKAAATAGFGRWEAFVYKWQKTSFPTGCIKYSPESHTPSTVMFNDGDQSRYGTGMETAIKPGATGAADPSVSPICRPSEPTATPIAEVCELRLHASLYCNMKICSEKLNEKLGKKHHASVSVLRSKGPFRVEKVASCSADDLKCSHFHCGGLGVMRVVDADGNFVHAGTVDGMLTCGNNNFTIVSNCVPNRSGV